jgi:general secretion pathway protein K
LQQLFESLAVEESSADSLSDAIIDWRDKNESAEINGAEQSEYESSVHV